MQNFKFDYDKENDDLFIYSTKSKSGASVEIGDVVFDFDKDKKLAAIEIMNATKFLKSLIVDHKFSKNTLSELVSCEIEVNVQDNFLLIKIVFLVKEGRRLPANLSLPRISASSPALKC